MNATLPHVSRAKRPATYEDLKQVPENMIAEILDGELIVTPRPASPHARAASIVLTDLVGPFDRVGGPGETGGWWLLVEPELHLHGDVVVPDVAGWRRERMPVMPSVPAFELSPDWICEVLSPRTARHDRRQKMRIYAREGVPFLWFVEPIERTLEVYRLEGTRWTTAGAFGDTDRVRAEPFAEIEIDLSR
jgi:Uma2 family endonuclease